MVNSRRSCAFIDFREVRSLKTQVLHRGENCGFEKSEKKINIFANKKQCGKRQTIIFPNPPKVIGRMAVVGEKEGKGPMGKFFQKIVDDDKMHEKTFEKAEIDMLTAAIKGAAENGKLKINDIDVLVAGDLLNQITSSSYVARELNIPYMGVYSACSTMSESLAVGASMVSAGYFNKVMCATVSHFATAERQFRYPLEYGCQRPPYAQWTVTGAGATLLSSEGTGPRITAATFGKVVDFGTNDLNNMGASMAPAAMSSLIALFKDTDTVPEDYDLILTGDLGKLGSDILRDLMREQGYDLGQNYIDCGSLVYDVTQKCYQGGSGCGCSASVINSFVFSRLESGMYNKVAYFATGALMSTQSCYQGETIPCISHGVILER